MSIVDQERRELLGYIWALKPSDLSVLQGCLTTDNSQMATPKGSNNDLFWLYLVEKKLAQEELLKAETLFEARSYSLIDEGRALLSTCVKKILNDGYLPEDAVFIKGSVEMLIKYSNENEPVSLNKLGTLIENGIGIFQSYEEALKLYERSAKLGYAKSMYDLGRLRGSEKGMNVNYIDVYYCFYSAIERGFDAKDAIENLKKKMTQHEIKMAYSLCTDKEYFMKTVTANIDKAFENEKLKDRSLKGDKSVMKKFSVWYWILKLLGKEKK